MRAVTARYGQEAELVIDIMMPVMIFNTVQPHPELDPYLVFLVIPAKRSSH